METFGFNLKLAKMIGTNEAIFLQMLYDIIERNKSVCVIEDNTIWFPCAIKEWSYYIDFWNYRQVDRIVKNCIRSCFKNKSCTIRCDYVNYSHGNKTL